MSTKQNDEHIETVQEALEEDEYRCKKCGEVCVIEFDDDHPGHPNAWCDECNDYPAGLYDDYDGKKADCHNITADYLGGLIDAAIAAKDSEELQKGDSDG